MRSLDDRVIFTRSSVMSLNASHTKNFDGPRLTMPDDRRLSERDWKSLLREIRSGKVIPVIGPGLVTVNSHHGTVPLHQYLAPQLARDLELDSPDRFVSYNDVARAYLLGGGDRNELYISLWGILDRLSPQDTSPSAALLELASITDFDLFVATTPDPLLARAVAQSRPGFSPDRGVIRFHPAGSPNRSSESPLSGKLESPCDLPVTFRGPLVYHVLGDYNTFPDFAVWEEDYLEFVCGLIESRDNLQNLFRTIKNRNLLLLGAPSQDWIVRFFLRAARGERLSDRKQRDYLADHCADLGEPMIFFFDKGVSATRIIDGSPESFVTELAHRWREAYGTSIDSDTFMQRQPEEMPRGSVFISYSHDDLAAAVRVGQALASAGVPVWLDRQRLQPGENFERSLEHAIKDSASFFISLISRTTEGNSNRYVHRERAWAAQKHTDGFVYYVPLIVDDYPDASIALEPKCFEKIHRERLTSSTLPAFVTRMRDYVERFRDSGRPRG